MTDPNESQPPIPPNSPRFRMYDGIAQFLSYDGFWFDIERVFKEINQNNENRRFCQDCVANAFKAWLDEAHKVPPLNNPVTIMNSKALNNWHMKCLANADAWDAWGKEEKS